VVAPLRVARGIQNKVLEAMAMARPVVVSAAAAGALSAVPATDFEVAKDAPEFVAKTLALMDLERGGTLGNAARRRVLADYDWTSNLTPFSALLEGQRDTPIDPPARARRQEPVGEARDA
jgi:glycosyltransferase involved in cell wall biosynthesis